jgi:hypothetical protein
MSGLRRVCGVALGLALACSCSAQSRKEKKAAGYDRAARATVLHDAIVYVAPEDNSGKLAEVTPGHEVIVISRSGPWVKVFANTDTPDDADPDANADLIETETVTPATGWIKDKGVVSLETPGGDAILFGAAANMEAEAAEPHAPKGAAAAAHLLYRRTYDYFPASKLAAEAAWRSADIRWQLDKLDISTLPSAKEQEAYLRPQLYDGEMKRVMKAYPGTRFAALAAYALIDNKLCGDWQGLPKCPEMETTLYLKYADQYPDSPKAAEAEYNALYRQGVLVSMYQVNDEKKRADAAVKRVQQIAAEMKDRFGQTDFAARGASVAYRVSQGIAIYGSDRE